MNTSGKSFTLSLLVTVIVLMLFFGFMIARDAPRYGEWIVEIDPNTTLNLQPHRLLYTDEYSRILAGIVYASVLTFLVVRVVMIASHQKRKGGFAVMGRQVPVWSLCLAAIVFSSILMMLNKDPLFILVLGLAGLLLSGVFLKFQRFIPEQSPSFVRPLMWVSISLIMFCGINIATIMAMLVLGFID